MIDGSWESLLVWAVISTAAILGLVMAVISYFLFCQARPVASDFTLPNGLKIRHYHKIETDWLYREIFEDGTYGKLEADDGKTVELKFTPGMKVVDVGGNIGMFALFALSKCSGDAEIHSFEPMPVIFEVLQQNCRLATEGKIVAGSKAKVVAHNVACGTKAGELEFEFHPRMSLWSTNDPSFDAERRDKMKEEINLVLNEHVPSYLACFRPVVAWIANRMLEAFQETDRVVAKVERLSDELKRSGVWSDSKSRIGLLKVDVEGAELEVLGGIDASDWARIDQVAMELEGVASRDAAAKILRGHGLSPHWAPAIKLKGAKEQRVWNLFAVRE